MNVLLFLTLIASLLLAQSVNAYETGQENSPQEKGYDPAEASYTGPFDSNFPGMPDLKPSEYRYPGYGYPGYGYPNGFNMGYYYGKPYWKPWYPWYTGKPYYGPYGGYWNGYKDFRKQGYY